MSSNIEEIEFTKEPLRDDDLYYVGRKKDDNSLWELMGVYEYRQNAFDNSKNGEFIVRFPRNKDLGDSLTHPKQGWWKIDGEILKSSRFVEDE